MRKRIRTAAIAAQLALATALAADARETYLLSSEEAPSLVEQAGQLVNETEASLVPTEEKPSAPDECCDSKRQVALNKAASATYAPLFYDNNFDYLCDECYRGWHLGEELKRLGTGACWVVDVGGQYRMRYHNEHNHRGLGLTGRDDDFVLHRTRLFVNAEYGDFFRAYFEGIDAQSNHEDFALRAIEVNRADILNAFADVKLHEGAEGELLVRLGRQELLYGNERTVSPLDWANTRRTFEGYRLMWNSDDWSIDGFWTQPVPVDEHRLDSPDQSQEFLGSYATYKKMKDQTLDVYFLRLSETAASGFYFNTCGARWLAKAGSWMAEVEGMYQFGRFGAADHDTGAFVAGLGRDFPHTAWTPTLWIYYDWASGDETVGNGYHHLFPLAHKYWGWMDLFGFRNLEDLNIQLTTKPSEKWKLIAWWHLFNLQDGDDVPYTVTMAPFVPAPGGDQELGQELDLILTWNVTERISTALGYSHFFAGDFYRTNPSAPFADDADFLYLMMQVNF